MTDEAPESDDRIIGRAFQASLLVLLCLGLAVAALRWGLAREELPERVSAKTFEAPDPAPAAPQNPIPTLHFTDVTAAAGIDFRHESGAFGDKLLPEAMGSGVAFFDADDDGDPDLMLVNAMRWPDDARASTDSPATMALYENRGDGSFRDVTAERGLALSLYGTGVAIGDMDGDGDRDLFVTALGSNRLLRNDGALFTDVTEKAGVGGEADGYSSSAGFFDADGDGDLDLFVLDYIHWSAEIDRELAFTLAGLERAYGPPLQFAGADPHLYRNDGEGRFTDISGSAGIQVRSTTGGAATKGLGLVFLDVNRDQRTDVLVSSDTTPNLLFVNLGDGRFEELGAESGLAYDGMGRSTGAMGIDVASLGAQGQLAIGIANFANEPSSLYIQQSDPLSFIDRAGAAGVGSPSRARLSFGLLFLDVDLDGRPDLLQANGHLESEIQRVQSSQHYRQSAQLFWNAGGARPRLAAVPAVQLGDLTKPIVGRASSYADIDGDGDLDVVLTQVGGAPLLLRNDQDLGHHWLRVRLVGRAPNTDALGARVTLRAGEHTQERYLSTTRGYLSQVEPTLTFGLGAQNTIDELRVRWPDGTVQNVPAPEPDRLLVLRQP